MRMSALGFAAICMAFALSVCTVALLAHLAARLPQDAPNYRSLHMRAVPRAGGYAIWAGFLPAALLFPPDVPGGVVSWFPPWMLVAAVSARDDVRGVSPVVRLLAHLVAGAWCAAWVWSAATGSLATADAAIAVASLAVLIAWACNLYNFMDGNDGLAATMTFAGFGAYGVAAMRIGDAAVPYFAL